MQDSGNHNNRLSLSSCCSSIVSDEAKVIYQINSYSRNIWNNFPRQILLSIGPDVLHRAIFIGHSFHLPYNIRHSFAYWALGEAYQL